MNKQEVSFLFKLRHNIALEGDVTLAEMELKAFLGESIQPVTELSRIAEEVPGFKTLKGLAALDACTRSSGLQGFKANGTVALLPELIRKLSFIQNIYCLLPESGDAKNFLAKQQQELGPVLAYEAADGALVVWAVPHYAVIELSDVIARRAKDPADTKAKLQAMLDGLLARTDNDEIAKSALAAKNTTSHLSHDLHYYKAKFFPRLVRSSLNICRKRLGDGPHRVIDNFSGSGTSLLESSLLGMASVGLDIDPLSVMIARSKLEMLHVPVDQLAREAKAVLRRLQERKNNGQPGLFDPDLECIAGSERIVFPPWLMKNRNMTAEKADELIREIESVKTAVAAAGAEVRDIFRVIMSDAIARKIKMRFLGTGVGRFSLTFTRRSIADSFAGSVKRYVQVAAAIEWLRETINLTFAGAEAVRGDARNVPEEMGAFDILVTSPPYLPAASGRESYAKARAPSLIALEMKTGDDVDHLVDDSVGSMNNGCVDLESLTEKEREVFEWLNNDELRQIKALPTARYFLDMRQTFEQMYRYLKPGGVAVVVSGKQSTFYEFESRKALHIVESGRLLADEAEKAGFEVEALHDVQLQKSNRNARPRSLDDYYETLIFLQRPT